MMSPVQVVFCLLAVSVEGVRQRRAKQASTDVQGEGKGSCADPVSAILETMSCISNKDSSCANKGYSRRGYDKYHNSRKASQSPFPAETYWTNAMKFSTFTTNVNYAENLGKNRAEIRYIENINMSDGSNFGLSPSKIYPFSARFKQYEHALVTVDDDCKIILWDQYGDNKEQSDVEDAINAMISKVGADAILAEDSEAELTSSGCSDPLKAIIHTMDCIENKNSTCANQGYNWLTFSKHHNGKNANVRLWPVDIYWSMAMKFSTFILDYDHKMNVGRNKASVRYVETIKFSNGTEFELEPSNVYPFNHTVIQYEHALVQVDNRCRIIRWDQYGDNQEQVDVTDAMDAFFANQGVKCHLKMEPLIWKCKK